MSINKNTPFLSEIKTYFNNSDMAETIILQNLVTTIARVFGLLDEEIYDAVINRSEEMAHIVNFYNLKISKLNLRNLNNLNI